MTPSFAFAYSSTDSKHAHSGSYADCKTAFKQPDDTCVQVGCSEDNVSVIPLQGMRDTDCVAGRAVCLLLCNELGHFLHEPRPARTPMLSKATPLLLVDHALDELMTHPTLLA